MPFGIPFQQQVRLFQQQTLDADLAAQQRQQPDLRLDPGDPQHVVAAAARHVRQPHIRGHQPRREGQAQLEITAYLKLAAGLGGNRLGHPSPIGIDVYGLDHRHQGDGHEGGERRRYLQDGANAHPCSLLMFSSANGSAA